MGLLPDGKKAFVWGGLPGETVEVLLTKSKASFAEGIVQQVLTASPKRVVARDPESFLSTSPWQIMPFEDELQAKTDLIREAFELHHIADALPSLDMYSDGVQYGYRNKVEFSWWWEHADDAAGTPGSLDLAFFKRGTHGKQPVNGTSLVRPEINALALAVRDLLRSKKVEARTLKTLLIRCDQSGGCVWQLYVKDKVADIITDSEAASLPAIGGEIIYSDPKSPASRITERLAAYGQTVLIDEILGVPFTYATEGFFQVNLPVYEQALRDMREWVGDKPTVDLYSGVGSIGLTIGNRPLTLVEVDQHAYREMERNITAHHLGELGKDVRPVLAPSEKALDYIEAGSTVIVDPPRAGLHTDVVGRLLEVRPQRIIYLSCNPVTQARDAALLLDGYALKHARGYDFFPRTPHIEHLLVLESL